MNRKAFLLLIALLISTIGRTQVPKNDIDLIKQARAASNQAIADHDAEKLAGFWMENYTIVTSRDNEKKGREINRKDIARHFEAIPDVIYIRTPNKIEVFEDWNMASENGEWVGRWTDGQDKIELSGSYYAKWHKVEGKWLMRAEVFTPLKCSGGSYCDKLP
ncbi:MAG: nuclear transport factor 2 family protein [Cyclobacteriaceae bacterium]